MATLYITEFSGVAASQVGGNFLTYARTPPVAEQTVAIGGTSTASALFNAATVLIRVHTDSICSIEIGASPTATTTKAADDSSVTADSLFVFADGGILLSPPLRVMAASAGTYAGQYYNPGDVFDIHSQTDYSDSTRNYEGNGAIRAPGWMLYVAASTPLYQAETMQPYPTYPAVDPNRRFVL